MYREYIKSLTKGNGPRVGIKDRGTNDSGEEAKYQPDFKAVDVPDYYQHPSEDVIRGVYQGSLQVPKLPRVKIVRFFSSSTFTDTAVERNALMTQVYPKLQGYCQSHGYDMQVVDMRWGVRDGMTDDHMTNELCMKELKLCQEVSTGPNFVTFLGQKYGYRPFPPQIVATEFEKISSNVSDLSDHDLLEAWFIKDNNNVPPLYRLQPISSKLPNFLSKNKELQRASSNAWWEIFERLQVILQKAASKAFTDSDVVHKYYRSVTEEEIYNGILKAPHPNFHTCWFKRTIPDAIKHTSERTLGRFIDMAGAGKVNQESQDLLKDLKENKLPAVLDKHNIITYDIKWCEDGGVNPDKEPSHRKYLDRFLADFEAVMSQRIETAIQARAAAEVKEPLFQEVIEHAVTCNTKVEAFHGREGILQKISGYISGDSLAPLVVFGVSGSGKTSVVAKAIAQSQKLLASNASVVFRFLGTTSDSSTITLLLHSLCKQISLLYGLDADTVPTTYQKLMEAFPGFLASATSERPLVIFLDSLDQLAVDDGARQMVWLPNKLPPNVKMILSTLPEEKYECYPQLRTILPSDKYYVEVPALPATDASTIVQSWLDTDRKALSPLQLEYLLKMFVKCPIPLFLRLIYDEAMRWRSYSPVNEIVLKETVRQVIANVFDRLELKHGFPLISHSFALITASKSGLSETELEDILSCEDEVLNDVYQYWTPPLRRLPPMLFARIRADLGNYLVSRGADGTQVLNWYHRQFVEEVRERYLSNEEHTRHVLNNLSDYFLGVWAGGVKKEFVTKKGEKDSADRHLLSLQPLYYGKSSEKLSERKFNLRKLNELPHCLIQKRDMDLLKQHVICNFEFLLAKSRAFSLDVLIDDIKAAEALTNDEEVKVVRETLQLAAKAIAKDPGELSSQLIGRLDQLVDEKPEEYKYVQLLLDGARSPSIPALVPQSQWLYPPGGQLIHTLPGHSKQVYGMALAKDNKRLVTASLDCTLRIWDLDLGRMFRKVDTGMELNSVELCNNDQIAVTSSKTSLNAWKVNTGEMMYEIPTEITVKFCFGGENDQLITALCPKAVRAWDTITGELKHEYVDEELTGNGKVAALGDTFAYFKHETKPFSVFIKSITDNTLKHTITLKMYCQSMMTTSQRALVVCVPMCIHLYNLDTAEEVMTIGLFDLYQPQRLQVTSDGKYLFGAVADLVKYWDLSSGKEEKFCKQSSGIMISNLVSQDLKTVAVSGGDNAIRLYDTSREEPVITREYTGNGLNTIGQLFLTPDTQRHALGVISYNKDFSMCVYNTVTGERVRKFSGIEAKSVQFVSDTVAFLQTDDACYTCDLNYGRILKKFPSTLAFLVKRPSAVYMIADCMTKIHKYDINSAKLVATIALHLEPDQKVDRNGMCFEESGVSAVYSVYHDYKSTTCYVLNMTTGKCTKVPFNSKFGQNLYHSSDLLLFQERPTDNQTNDQGVNLKVFSLKDDKFVQTFNEKSATLLQFISCSKLNKLAYSLTNSVLRIYDTTTWALSHTLNTYSLYLTLVRDDSVLITASTFASNSNLCLWDMETGSRISGITPDETMMSSALVTKDAKCITVAIQRTEKPTTFKFHGLDNLSDSDEMYDDGPFGISNDKVIQLEI